MQVLSPLPLWVIVPIVLAFYKTISIIVSKRRHAARAHELGCKPPPKWPDKPWDPLGIVSVRHLQKADREKRLPPYAIERMEQMSELEGRVVTTMELSQLGKTMFFTSDPKNIQAILAHQFKDFGLGSTRRANFLPLLGSGIFTQDGKEWEHSRTLLRPQFNRGQVSDLDLEERHVQNMMLALPVGADSWTDVVNLQDLFFRLTLDSATEFLFGESVDSQLAAVPGYSVSRTTPNHDESTFAYAFDAGQNTLSEGARLGDRYWLAHRNSRFRQHCNDVHKFIDYYVQLALNHELKDKELERGTRYVFLEALAAETRDPVELRSQLLNILLAGRDTTASLLGWLCLLLVEHPDIFDKLRQTILDDFGTYSNPHNVTFETLKSCQYLQRCLNETLRLYPVVPINSRRALVDTTIPRGGGPDGTAPIYILKDTEVNYSVHVLHRRKDLWGEDADEFKPDRWIGRRPGWEYLPFNGGPRICIGQQFALTEASYVMVRLLQRFDRLEGVNTPKVVRHGLALTSHPYDGVVCRLHEAPA